MYMYVMYILKNLNVYLRKLSNVIASLISARNRKLNRKPSLITVSRIKLDLQLIN